MICRTKDIFITLEPIYKIMNESSLSEMRNYTTAAGFLVLAFILMEFFICQIMPAAFIGNVSLFAALALIIFGTILAIERKRDIAAIAFLMTGLVTAFPALQTVKAVSPDMVTLITGVFLLLLALVILTAKDKTKYLLSVPLILIAVYWMWTSALEANSFSAALLILAAVILIYYAFACVSEKLKLPLSDTLRADTETDFKTSGSVLGYLLLGMIFAVWALLHSTAWTIILPENVAALEVAAGLMLMFVGILLWAVGKMKFTPIMFFLLGLFFALGSQTSAIEMLVPIGVMVIFVGIFLALRSDARILPAIMIVLSGSCVLLFSFFGTAGNPVFLCSLNIIQLVIAVYLAFAVFSQSKKLPLF
ncbi:hypothetical protein McpAg1_03060 [Methanocorpusculaceae archaeon Ag1]|uniref:DUF4401 domain-containing protein n=2 Tax=Methanorbis furvi TaxID=3028299 RepID=A0AAE4M9N4_9EURY|nr:hypothetical protein [Methanocorpusculaceae archaeon Ag1]